MNPETPPTLVDGTNYDQTPLKDYEEEAQKLKRTLHLAEAELAELEKKLSLILEARAGRERLAEVQKRVGIVRENINKEMRRRHL